MSASQACEPPRLAAWTKGRLYVRCFWRDSPDEGDGAFREGDANVAAIEQAQQQRDGESE